ncbi:histidine phosphatase superfamily [Triangularia verruculosa]|uniref:Histidine phosphatase superfamily n=1 Tax=Triangularia verruculosa TaxID=2587418 RepID=A0AAN7AU50_9PEZI|nr:histidine phosphatase superfamily [Triangularia verruculosa]
MSPTKPKIFLVRHAESVHNVTKDFNIRDPGLTQAGHQQAAALGASFPDLSSVAVVISSPLTRAIETTLDAFGSILPGGNNLILDPYLQERSDLACDTGSPISVLKERFPSFPDVIWSSLSGNTSELDGDDWLEKKGDYAADDDNVTRRAEKVRKILWNVAQNIVQAQAENAGEDLKKNIVVVTHGVFMQFLTEDETIDLPKAGWKDYYVEEADKFDGQGKRIVLAPVPLAEDP